MKNFRAKKHLGQNFLRNQDALEGIINAAELQKTDTVLEVGAGDGTLTMLLAPHVKKIIAIEIDHDLIPRLKAACAPYNNVEIIAQSVLHAAYPGIPYKLVANIPYYITSPILNHFFLEAYEKRETLPTFAVLLMQKEVAKKICATPGDLSVLALNVQLIATTELLFTVPAKSFVPAPKVDSVVVKITPHRKVLIEPEKIANFRKLIHAGFSQKRKMLKNTLAATWRKMPTEVENLLKKCDINPQRRAETLTVPEWIKILENLA